MKKKTIIIIIIAVAIVAIGVWMYLKGKKKTSLAPSIPGTSTVPGAGFVANAAPAATASSQAAPVAPVSVQAANANPGAEAFGYSGVQRDGSQGKAIICYQPLTKKFAVGDVINITSGPYAGQSKIWHIYDFASGGFAPGAGQNLYIDKPFVSNDKGTFFKV